MSLEGSDDERTAVFFTARYGQITAIQQELRSD